MPARERSSPGRRYASPSRKTGRPRYYFDTERGAFYTIPSHRFPRAHRLDVQELMTRQGTRTDFRVRDNGDVYFRGVKINHNVHERTVPQRLKSKVRRKLTRPPRNQYYYENIASLNPMYQLIDLRVVNGVVVGIYRNPINGRTFTVKS
jgi:hypothetical protein